MLDVLAQSDALLSGSPIAPWAQLAATTVVAGLLVWLITKEGPRREMAQQEARDRMTTDNRETIRELAREFREITDKISDRFFQQLEILRLQNEQQRQQHALTEREDRDAINALAKGFSQLADAVRNGNAEKER